MPGFSFVRIVDFTVLVYFPEDGFDVAVVRFHDGGFQKVGIGAQAELELVERAGGDIHRKAFIADNVRREHAGLGRPGFQAEFPFQVGGDADGGAVEVNAYVGERLSRLEIGDGASYAGGLRHSLEGREHHEKKY